MNKAEATIQAEAMLAVGCEPGVRVFRNSVGSGWMGEAPTKLPDGTLILQNARPVTFGLCPGSADAIGWRSVTITPDMVGQRVAVFAALEFKTMAGKPSQLQRNFLEAVREAGGIADIVRSATEAKKLLRIA